MKYADAKKHIDELIERNIDRLETEIDDYETKIRDNVSYYGEGGPIGRQRKAVEDRQEELADFERLQRGYGKTVKTFKLKLYYTNCLECGATVFSTDFIKKGYHECPCCGKTTFRDPSQSTEIEVVEDSKLWLQAIKEKTLQEVTE